MEKITRDTLIADLLRVNRDAAAVLLGYGMHCLGCPVAKGESIGQAAAAHGIDEQALLKSLNELTGADA